MNFHVDATSSDRMPFIQSVKQTLGADSVSKLMLCIVMQAAMCNLEQSQMVACLRTRGGGKERTG